MKNKDFCLFPNEVTFPEVLRDAEATLLRITTFGIKQNSSRQFLKNLARAGDFLAKRPKGVLSEANVRQNLCCYIVL